MSTASLEQLARVLAKNYFDTSLTFADGENRVRKLRENGSVAFEEEDAYLAQLPSERTLLVLGSGASIGAFGSSYPGTNDAIQRIRDVLRLDDEEHPAVDLIQSNIDQIISEITDKYDYADAKIDFETNLAVLAQIFGQTFIADQLAEMYGPRHYPHLAFEIIAHLFKHRFIDAIINFNFDELLDEAIAGEMGTGQYNYVLFDGECRGLAPLLVDNRLKIPLYIKPHGTVSYPSTMRFTKDQYFQLPDPMRDLMSSVVSGDWLEDPQNPPDGYKPRKVNVITVGFSMKSVDLLDMMHAAGPSTENRITLYHLNVKDGFEQLRSLARIKRWDELGIAQEFIDVESNGGLAGTFHCLWELAKSHFRPSCRPRGIARHQIVHTLFFSSKAPHLPGTRLPSSIDNAREPNNRDLNYFRGRLYAEVAMALARGNGQIDLSAMSSSRMGRYFDLMRNCPNGADVSMHEILTPFADERRVEFVGPDSSIFRISTEASVEARVMNRTLATTLWNRLSSALRSIDDARLKRHIRTIDNEEMIGWFQRLTSSDAQDISPNFKHSHLLLSREPRSSDVLHTSLGLTLRFIEMLNNERWDMLVAVSEHGKLLEKYQRHVEEGNIRHSPHEKQFCIVLAESEMSLIVKQRLNMFQGRLLQPSKRAYYAIPPWMHNQHMVLLLRREGSIYIPVSGVRYEKLGLGNRVNPIYINNSQEDLDAAFSCFKRYVYMSEHDLGTTISTPTISERDLRIRIEHFWNSIANSEVG